MFNNLIESTSHAKEFKRRGSFLLITTVTYAVLLAFAGVASIYAYDAHLDTQSTEIEITYVPLDPQATQPQPIRNTPRDTTSPGRTVTRPERTDLIDSPSNPNNVPHSVSTAPQLIPPAPPNAVISYRNVDPPPVAGRGVPNGKGNTPVVDISDPPPPPPAPAPKPTPVAVLKISKVLNSQAIKLPKPDYPLMAKQIRIQGTVNVQVLIDENGRVISAKAVAGHPLLVAGAVKAAMQAIFSPTIINDQPVKVSGVISYNFVMP
jgi:periplasmic protein TonB